MNENGKRLKEIALLLRNVADELEQMMPRHHASQPLSAAGGGEPRILRRPEVESRTGLSRSAIYKAMQDGDFPRPVRITKGKVGWRSSEIDQWISSLGA